MYESTRPDDEHLRVPVTALCVKNSGLLPAASETVKVLEEHEHSVWAVYKPLMNDGFGQGYTGLQAIFDKVNNKVSMACIDCGSTMRARFMVTGDVSIQYQCGHCLYAEKL